MSQKPPKIAYSKAEYPDFLGFFYNRIDMSSVHWQNLQYLITEIVFVCIMAYINSRHHSLILIFLLSSPSPLALKE